MHPNHIFLKIQTTQWDNQGYLHGPRPGQTLPDQRFEEEFYSFSLTILP